VLIILGNCILFPKQIRWICNTLLKTVASNEEVILVPAKLKSAKKDSSKKPVIHPREQAAQEVFILGFVMVAVLFLGVSIVLIK